MRIIIFSIIICLFILLFKIKISKKKEIIDNTNHIIINKNFINKKILDNLRDKFPDLNNKKKYKLSFVEVGDFLSEKWNIPKDESYYKEGVIVDQVEPPRYFKSKEWKKKISNVLKLNYNYLKSLTWKYKRNVENSNGLWLHTDIRNEEERNILVLIYVGDKATKKNGGELLIFKEISKYNKNIPLIKGYQSGYKLDVLKNIKKKEFLNVDSVGGEWLKNKTPTTFKCVEKILPEDGLVVIMDYRNKYNIHAVSPKLNYERNVIEQWFSYSEPRI